MTAAGFLYRRLVKHPTPKAPTGALLGQGVPGHPESAAVGDLARRPVAPPAPSQGPTAQTDAEALRRREIFENLPYGLHLAARSGMAAQPVGDLRRVAYLGMGDAVDHFDPGRGVTFLAYAASTIRAQARRHLLDVARAGRTPRRIAEIASGLPQAVESLTGQGRSPTVAEVAAHLDALPETGRGARGGRRARSGAAGRAGVRRRPRRRGRRRRARRRSRQASGADGAVAAPGQADPADEVPSRYGPRPDLPGGGRRPGPRGTA